MGAFSKNSLLLLVDEAEPILPVFRSSDRDRNDPGRIVELTDVGCDTEAIFPVPFRRSVARLDRRGRAEDSASTRRVPKWRDKRSSNFTTCATHMIANDVEGRNENYSSGKARWSSNSYNDAYIAGINYDLYADVSYDDDDLELLRAGSAAAYGDDYYTEYIDTRNFANGHSRDERRIQDTRCNFTRDFESPFAWSDRACSEYSERAYRRENTRPPRWFIDSDMRSVDETRHLHLSLGRSLSSECRKRTEVVPRVTEVSEDPRESFVLSENEPNYEDLARSAVESMKNHDRRRRMTLQRGRSRTRDSQQRQPRADVTDSAREETCREALSTKTRVGSARHGVSKSDEATERFVAPSPNLRSAGCSRARSARLFYKGQSSNVRSHRFAQRGETAVDTRRSTLEKKTDDTCSAPSEMKEKITNIASVLARDDDGRYCGKFGSTWAKLSSKAVIVDETGRSEKMVRRVAHSKSNERAYAPDEDDDVDDDDDESRANYRERFQVCNNDEMDRAAFSPPKQETTGSERSSATSRVAPRTRAETEKKRSSRLPVRTWKRSRTRAPAISRSVNHEVIDDPKLREVDVALANDRAKKENGGCEKIAEDDATRRDRGVTKRKDHRRVGSLDVDEPKSLSNRGERPKRSKGSNTTKGLSERREKRTSAE